VRRPACWQAAANHPRGGRRAAQSVRALGERQIGRGSVAHPVRGAVLVLVLVLDS